MELLRDLMQSHLSPAAVHRIGELIGAAPDETRSAIDVVAPALASSMARSAQSSAGAAALHALLTEHNGTDLDDVMACLCPPYMTKGTALLHHLFGSQQARIETRLAGGTGLPPAALASLMTLLAPLVMSTVGRIQREQNLDPTRLAALLEEHSLAAHAVAPEFMNFVSNLFDPQHESTTVENLSGLAQRLFGR